MKTFLFLILFTALLAGHRAEASSSTYECAPFRSDDANPKGWKLPETFRLTVRGPEAQPEIMITVEGKTTRLKSNPFSRRTENSEKFDRYAAEGLGTILVAKEAASLPSHFTTKLDYEADSYHGTHAYLGYNCR